MIKKALIYCRVSSQRQVSEGDGLGSQEFRCLQFAASRGLTVEKVFHDEGISGSFDLFQRPAMKKLLIHLDQNPNDQYFIIFDDMKRFARDTLLHFKLKQELSLRGAKPLCLNFNFEETPEGKFIETLYAAFGQLERQQNQRQVINRMKSRLERGYWVFRLPPVGYKMINDLTHGKLCVLEQPSARRVKSVLNGFASGRFQSKREIMNYLKAHPLSTKGKRIQSNYNLVDRILGNVFYTGYLEYPKWGVPRTKGKHKALITMATHDAIISKLKERQPKLKLKNPAQFHLTGLIKCAYCEAFYTCSRSKGRSKYYHYYTCKQVDCLAPLKNIPKEKLEADYCDLLKEFTPDPDILTLIINQLKREYKSSESVTKEEISKTTRVINAKEKEIKTILERACTSKSNVVREKYEQHAEELSDEITRLKVSQNRLKKVTISEVIDIAENFMRTVANDWENRSRSAKITIHRLYFPTQLYYGQNIGLRTASKPLPQRVYERFEGSESTMVDNHSNHPNQFPSKKEDNSPKKSPPLNIDQATAHEILHTFIQWEPILKDLSPNGNPRYLKKSHL